MDETQEKEIYLQAWAKFKDLQYIMVIEECSELQKAITKLVRHDRGPTPTSRREDLVNNVLEEVADVEVMLGQLKANLPLGAKKVGEYKEGKLKRLEQLLKK